MAFATVMALIPRPPQIGPSDEFRHMLAFAVLTALACAGWPRTRLIAIGAGLAAFGAAIEVVQAIPALDRDPSLADWLADLVAVAAVLLAAAALRLRSPGNRSRPD